MGRAAMANMLEYRCFGKMDCGAHFLIGEFEDPTSSTGCCKTCGGNNWQIRETSLTEQEYFRRRLKDPHGTIGYHIISENLV
jgi:hypothetical protein